MSPDDIFMGLLLITLFLALVDAKIENTLLKEQKEEDGNG